MASRIKCVFVEGGPGASEHHKCFVPGWQAERWACASIWVHSLFHGESVVLQPQSTWSGLVQMSSQRTFFHSSSSFMLALKIQVKVAFFLP
eukprot:180457-Pelagomonas_calceolata.AAC.2